MFRRSVVSLGLAFIVTGCGSQELRSPECDQGLPVIASGQFRLGPSVSEADVSSVTLELRVSEEGEDRTLSEAKLGEGVDFPLAFTLCADLGELGPEATVSASLTVLRGNLMEPVGGGDVLPYAGTPLENLDILVGGAFGGSH
jgi:hypothetical protein